MIEFQMISNAVFFGAVPVLAALYMLKLNRRNKKIPSVYFIKDLVSDNKGSSLFKRLTSNMLLFLEILFLIILALALMNPGRAGQSLLRKKMILLVDNSITMSSVEAGGVLRLSRAIKMAEAAVYDNPNSSVSVIEFSAAPKLLADSENSRSEAVARIRTITPTHLAPDYKTAVALAEGLCGEDEAPEIHIFSDFCSWRGSGAGVSKKTTVVFHKAGEAARNIGVCTLEVSQDAEGGGSAGYNIFFTVKNYCDYEVSIPASVFIDKTRASSSVLTIAGGGAESKILKKYGSMPAEVSVEIITSDVLGADDKRVWLSSGHKTFKALVLSGSPYFYKAALEAAGADAVDASEANIPKALYRQREYDLAVIDDTGEAALLDKYKCRSFIVFDPPEGFFGSSLSGPEQGVTVKTPEFPYAYMRAVDLNDIYIHQMQKAALNQNFGQIVYSSSAAPLFAVINSQASDIFAVFFDPRASNFPLKISFPIFFSNIINIVKSKKIAGDIFFAGGLNYFGPARLKPAETVSKLRLLRTDAGGPGSAGVLAAAAPLYLDLPAGATAKPIEAPQFTLAGLYRAFDAADAKGADTLFEFFVNPPPGRILSVKPVQVSFQALSGDKAAPASFESSHISYAAPLILLAVLILLLDWVYQNHRTFYKKGAGL
jgi:hypothetical protein